MIGKVIYYDPCNSLHHQRGGGPPLSERGRYGRGPESQPPREQDRPPYLRTARYPGALPAGSAYDQVQALLYRSRGVDLSAFRFQLDQVYHVAVLGLVPPERVAQTIDRLLAGGEPASLPGEIVQLLVRRRREESRRSPWVEKHYRPGKRFD